MKKLKFGFTMIELLIVIAILGILAVAVLSAINPLEQINRGRDTQSRGDAEQLINAVERYNASKGRFPWQANPNEVVSLNALDSTSGVDDTDITDFSGIMAILVDTNEVKTGYANRIQQSTYNPLYAYWDSDDFSNSVYVCFSPKSKSFRTEAAEDCAVKVGQGDFEIVEGGACPDYCVDGVWNGIDDCQICLP
ncbi:type II secretion system GspH family protein [Patescibacteria group bacterium]|nr:type II secretion system GspH family protein [Patescibacteria group bacterium]MBU1931711.1 type II secretion system GspH family protein [Patescibacteria group bacterium]